MILIKRKLIKKLCTPFVTFSLKSFCLPTQKLPKTILGNPYFGLFDILKFKQLVVALLSYDYFLGHNMPFISTTNIGIEKLCSPNPLSPSDHPFLSQPKENHNYDPSFLANFENLYGSPPQKGGLLYCFLKANLYFDKLHCSQ